MASDLRCKVFVVCALPPYFDVPLSRDTRFKETYVGGCSQVLDDLCNSVATGSPVQCVEIMLQRKPFIKDRAGLPHLHTDAVGSSENNLVGRAKIVCMGQCISMAYFGFPNKTKEKFDLLWLVPFRRYWTIHNKLFTNDLISKKEARQDVVKSLKEINKDAGLAALENGLKIGSFTDVELCSRTANSSASLVPFFQPT